jgi:hypothetical protein
MVTKANHASTTSRFLPASCASLPVLLSHRLDRYKVTVDLPLALYIRTRGTHHYTDVAMPLPEPILVADLSPTHETVARARRRRKRRFEPGSRPCGPSSHTLIALEVLLGANLLADVFGLP